MNTAINIFDTKAECESYIVQAFGALYLEQEIAVASKIGPTICKSLGLDRCGYAASNELRGING